MSGLHYALRLDVDQLDKPTLSEWLSANGTGFLVCYEEAAGENPHVHVVLYTDKKMDALRKSFTRGFPTKTGNGGYSLKKCDDDVDAYMRYLCKGTSPDIGPCVWTAQGLDFTPEKVADAHARYWVNNAALVQNKVKRVKCATIVEELELLCKRKGVRKGDKEAIALEYIKLYRDGRKGINIFHARSVVNTVACLLDDSGDTERILAAQIAQ